MKIAKEIKIAITAILSIVIIYFGAIFLKGISLSHSNNIFLVEMEDVNGLAEAAPVLANGVQVGTVKNLKFVTDKQNVLLTIELNEGITIPQGTMATLTKEMLGAPKVKLILGNNKNGFLNVNDTIMGMKSNDLMALAGDMMPQIDQIVGKIDSIAYEINILMQSPAIANSLYNVQAITSNVATSTRELPEIVSDFNTMASNLKIMSNNMKGMSQDANFVVDDAKNIMGNVKNAAQSVDNMCNDMQKKMPEIMDNANHIAQNLSTTSDKISQMDVEQLVQNLNNTVSNLATTTAQINQILANDNSTAAMMLKNPDVYNHLDSTLLNASRLLEDFRNHPKRYVHFSVFGKKDK